MPIVQRKYSGSGKSHTQSVRFQKEYWTKDKARLWIIAHNFKIDGFEETENEFRYRQYDPEISKYRYNSKELPRKGIYLILGYAKR